MKNFFKTFSFLFFLLTLASCGKETKTNYSSSQLSLNGLQLSIATIYVPAPDMVGGGTTIKINGTDYRIDSSKSSSTVSQYLTALYYRQIQVTPKSSSRHGKEYNVGYTGTLEEGSCMSNPMAKCTNAVLTQLVAF